MGMEAISSVLTLELQSHRMGVEPNCVRCRTHQCITHTWDRTIWTPSLTSTQSIFCIAVANKKIVPCERALKKVAEFLPAWILCLEGLIWFFHRWTFYFLIILYQSNIFSRYDHNWQQCSLRAVTVQLLSRRMCWCSRQVRWNQRLFTHCGWGPLRWTRLQ